MRTELPIPPEASALAEQKKQEATQILTAFEALPVSSPEEIALATRLFREVKDRFLTLDEQRKGIVRPMQTAIERTNDLFRPALNALREAQNVIRDKLARAETARLRANQEARLDARLAAATGQGSPSEALARVQPPEATKPADNGLGFRHEWAPVVENALDVPREFLEIDYKKLRTYGKQWGKSESIPHVPGIRWERKAIPVIRGK